MNKNVEVARKSLKLGYNCFNKKKYGPAFAHFLMSLNQCSDFCLGLKETFITCLCEWGNMLENMERYSDLFQCYKHALNFYPDSEVITYNLGAHLLRLNHYKEAAKYFRESLKLDKNFLIAYRSLQNVSNLIVERWHFRMLNDFKRNLLFREAVCEKLSSGNYPCVLDVGCGTGILSLFAADAGGEKIFACDFNEAMVSLAEEIISLNSQSDVIKVINKWSIDLLIPEDIPCRANLLITETFDAGLLGENFLQTLDDAWNRLLLPDASVIPCGATIYGRLVESIPLAQDSKILHHPRNTDAFKIGNFISTSDEPYDNRCIASLDHTNLSNPFEIFKIDFCNRQEISKCLAQVSIEFEVNCVNSGFLDAVIVWFDLSLTKDIILSTSPEESSCWDQAVFSVKGHFFMRKNDKMKLSFSISDGVLTLVDCIHISPRYDSSLANIALTSSAIKFLNDSNTLSCLQIFMDSLPLPKESNILEISPYPFVSVKLLEKFTGCNVCATVCPNDCDNIAAIRDSLSSSVSDFISFSTFQQLEIILEDKKFHLIVINLIEPTGELNENLLQLLPLLRSSLKEEIDFKGAIFPNCLRIHCQLIQSEWLLKSTKISDDSVGTQFIGFDSINDFHVDQLIDVNLNEIDKLPLSDKICLASIALEDLADEVTIKFSLNVEILNAGEVDGIAYWFAPAHDNFNIELAPLNPMHHYKHCVQVMASPINIEKGNIVLISVLYRMGVVKFSLETVATDSV